MPVIFQRQSNGLEWLRQGSGVAEDLRRSLALAQEIRQGNAQMAENAKRTQILQDEMGLRSAEFQRRLEDEQQQKNDALGLAEARLSPFGSRPGAAAPGGYGPPEAPTEGAIPAAHLESLRMTARDWTKNGGSAEGLRLWAEIQTNNIKDQIASKSLDQESEALSSYISNFQQTPPIPGAEQLSASAENVAQLLEAAKQAQDPQVKAQLIDQAREARDEIQKQHFILSQKFQRRQGALGYIDSVLPVFKPGSSNAIHGAAIKSGLEAGYLEPEDAIRAMGNLEMGRVDVDVTDKSGAVHKVAMTPKEAAEYWQRENLYAAQIKIAEARASSGKNTPFDARDLSIFASALAGNSPDTGLPIPPTEADFDRAFDILTDKFGGDTGAGDDIMAQLGELLSKQEKPVVKTEVKSETPPPAAPSTKGTGYTVDSPAPGFDSWFKKTYPGKTRGDYKPLGWREVVDRYNKLVEGGSEIVRR